MFSFQGMCLPHVPVTDHIIILYVLGRSSNKMPAAVKEAIAFTVETQGGRTPEDAQDFVAMMEREGRLVEECWS